MKYTWIFLSFSIFFLVSCSTGSEDNSGSNDEILEEASALTIDTVALAKKMSDSIELKRFVDSVEFGDQFLMDLQVQFLDLLKSKDYAKIQEMLHSDGIYYFTVGRIAKSEFNLKGIKKSKGILDGAYTECDECPVKIVNGDFWLDSITAKLVEGSGYVHSRYGAVGFGFSGNYSSDHIPMDILSGDNIEGYLSDPEYRVIYSYYDKGELSPEYLMLEFVKENDEWKIYAIGNLEWTP